MYRALTLSNIQPAEALLLLLHDAAIILHLSICGCTSHDKLSAHKDHAGGIAWVINLKYMPTRRCLHQLLFT